MAAQIKTLTFASRQEIPDCTKVAIHFSQGDWPVEYRNASEIQLPNGSWQYQFYVLDVDAPGGMTLDDFANCNVETNVVPYFHCIGAGEEEAEPEECPSRLFNSFTDLEIVNKVNPSDYLAVLRFDPVCQQFVMKAVLASDFVPDDVSRVDATDWSVIDYLDTVAGFPHVTRLKRDFLLQDGFTISVATIGLDPITFGVFVNGTNLLEPGQVIELYPPSENFIHMPQAVIAPEWQNTIIPAGSHITMSVTTAEVNWKGLRLGFRGIYK